MKKFNKIFTVIVMLFLYLPMIVLGVASFNSGMDIAVFKDFTFDNYGELFKDSVLLPLLLNSVIVAVISSLIATVIGSAAAIGIHSMGPRLRSFTMGVTNIPLTNPEIVTGVSLALLFAFVGTMMKINNILGFATLLIAHITFNLPYVILSVMPKIRSLDPNLADAAMDLGATPWRALTKVIVPQIMPGIVSGALIAFTMSIDDFIISYFVTGGGVKNLSITVYTMSKRVNPSINAISTLVVLLITAVLVLINVAPKRMAQRAQKAELRGHRIVMPTAVAVCAAVAVLVFVKVNGGNSALPYEGQTLHVYNWGEYTGENLLNDFEAKTGAKVVMENFDSNEQMYIKVANGETYDVLVPSDYMIQRLIGEDYLQKLDKTKLDCMDKLCEDVIGLPYDPNNDYSIPYFWGTVGIVYDKNQVDIEDLEREGFEIFRDPKYRGNIYLYDSERDSFMMALKALGYSMNTSSEKELQEAYEWLVSCVQTMKPEIVTDEIIDNMAQGRKALGLIYSGDAAYVMAENEDMGYYLPESGTNLWSDAMVIPANAKNPELAHEFINFVSDYEGAYDNSSFVGYTSANQEVMDTLYGEGGEYEGIDAYMPRSGYPKDEVFEYNEDTRKTIANLWSKVKIAASNAE